MTTICVGDKSEIKSWLEMVLKKENLINISVNILGTSEKGDGYMGDIIFVFVSGVREDGFTKEYNLALKCSKRSPALRNSLSIMHIYLNEIFVYNEIFPNFIKFQRSKGIREVFDSFPKCYGMFRGEDVEVLVLEDLKKSGYELWPRKEPLKRKHIDLVVNEYGKFHAISVVMKEQQPDKFQAMVHVLEENLMKLSGAGDMGMVFKSAVDEVYDLLKNDLDEDVMERWKNFAEQINHLFNEMSKNIKGLRVIIHGDSWNNNFMFKYEDGDLNSPSRVSIFDWQIARYSSPILDLSYFLFSCISKVDIEDIHDILKMYHKSFTDHLAHLGVSNELYPFKQLLDEWKCYSRHGVMMASLVLKSYSSDKDEILDISQTVESGKDFTDSFLSKTRNTDHFKNRIRHIVEYVAKHKLI
jgi:thiamine kinase-like enzyme